MCVPVYRNGSKRSTMTSQICEVETERAKAAALILIKQILLASTKHLASCLHSTESCLLSALVYPLPSFYLSLPLPLYIMSDLPLSTSDLRQEIKIRMGAEGTAALPPKTVMQNFDEIVKSCGDKPALHQKKIVDGQLSSQWTTWTWSEYRSHVDSFAKSLISIGFQRFDTINIIGFNSPEWLFSNFGAIAAGGVSAGIYTTNSPEACKYISEHSAAKVVVCEGLKQLEKYYGLKLPSLKALVMYGPDKLPDDIKTKCSVPCYTFEEFLKLGKSVADAELKARVDAWKYGETCTLIYTSGTTGPPKGT